MANGVIKILNSDDSGWIFPELSSSFTTYTTNMDLRYRRKKHVVNIIGQIKPTTSLSGSINKVTIFTLPEGFRPLRNLEILCQGSGVYVWACEVDTNGVVSFSRYRQTTSYKSAGTSVWLPINITFFTAD